MKKLLSIAAVLFISTQAFSQFYISASGGYSIGSAGTLMGTELNADQTKATNYYGSYGEGLNGQLRGGYFFNDTFGVELSLGYLHGADQVKDSYKTYYTVVSSLGNSTAIVNEVTDAKAYARAYGLSLALIYNFNKNIYGKFGAVTKVGGKTIAEATNTVDVKLAEAYGPYAAGTQVKTVTTNLEQEFHGKLPLGFLGAMGYRYSISDKVALFAELEYLGINVKRDHSKYTKFTSTDANALTSQTTTTTLDQLPTSMKEFEYVDSLPVPYTNTDTSKPTKQLSEISPYSSFGLNIGLTFTLGK